MTKDHYETFVVVIGQRKGKRYADRRRLQVPVALATGNYERLSTLQLREAINDLAEEATRRGVAESDPTPQYDPLSSQIRRPA